MKIDIRASWRRYAAGAVLALGGLSVAALLASGAIANAAEPTYEAHLITADGQRVTVEVGKDFSVTGTEQAGPRK